MKTNSALKKIAIVLTAGAVSIGAATPVMAHPGWGYGERYEYGGRYRPGDYYEGGRGYYGDMRYDRGYRGHRGYRGEIRAYHGYRCRDDGVGGAIIGAVAGGLIGNQVAERGDRTTGTVVGGALGAVAGHLIDKSDGRRC